MGSSTGRLFRVTTWGESHGAAVGAVVDGCPPRLPLSEDEIQVQLDRRRPGQSRLTTQRQEKDRVRILSGLFEGRTLGTPILLMVENEDAKATAYEPFRDLYRPSHADYTVETKYGIRDWRGGGRASARETVGRVAAGSIAEKLLATALGIEIVAWVARVADIEAAVDPMTVRRADVDATATRCPDLDAAGRIAERIDGIRREGDSLGGVVELCVRGLPPGLGEPVFEKLDADLASAMMGLPAAKGVEIGSGFEGTTWTGSRHNDPFVPAGGRIRTASNHSGGIQGGISNGEALRVRVGFKPTATIRKEQATVDRDGQARTLAATGRHDPCVLPRAIPIVEAMAALVLADHWLRQLALSVAADRIGGTTR